MIILGLTGSIGMGKTTTAGFFVKRGIRLHDADATVHALYGGAAVAPVGTEFPGTIVDGRVDRGRLGEIVLQDRNAMARLEALVHPLVRQAEDLFLAKARSAGAPLVVLDIPLLFETGGAARCHGVVVVTASAQVQRERVLARPGMTPARLEAILSRQMPDAEKRRRAHALIETDRGFAAAQAQVDDLLRALAGCR